MKDTIYTIPISEVFEPMDGCPICRLRDMLEDRCLEYIMGAAMMEPDIRIDTNRQGFCHFHFSKMMTFKNRLSLALMLESHLDYVKKELLPQNEKMTGKGGMFSKEDKASPVRQMLDGCYVCGKIDWALGNMIDTTLKMWDKDAGFRSLYEKQPYLCLEHYDMLCAAARHSMNKKSAPAFIEVSTKLTREYLEKIRGDVKDFCSLFDYRRDPSKQDDEAVRNSIERSVAYLTSRQGNETLFQK